jgi:hypothetical protein
LQFITPFLSSDKLLLKEFYIFLLQVGKSWQISTAVIKPMSVIMVITEFIVLQEELMTGIIAGPKIHITICNLDHENGANTQLEIRGLTTLSNITGIVLTADSIQAHNTFELPDAVKPAAFNGITQSGNHLQAELPSKSVVLITIEP